MAGRMMAGRRIRTSPARLEMLRDHSNDDAPRHTTSPYVVVVSDGAHQQATLAAAQQAELPRALLDSLLDVDGSDRCALVAVAVDAEDSPGVGLARYGRSREDPALAEAAVTVVEAYQQRGIATALLQRLAGEALRNGISTFTATVMWENGRLLDRLRVFGAEVSPSEPGVASVRIALPDADVAAPECQLRRALRVFAARVDEMIVLRFDR